MGADVVIAIDLGSDLIRRFARNTKETAITQPSQNRLISALLARRINGVHAAKAPYAPPLPSIIGAMLGAIDIMQEATAQRRLRSDPPDVLLTPHLGQFGPFEYHRAALAIEEGRDAVAKMLPAIRHAVGT